MEVFSFALQKRAVKIILVHNQPNGELKPSDKIKDITDRLIQVGIIVKTEVFDHLIISERSYLSFADIGLMEQLRESKKWVPTFELIEDAKKEAKKEATEIAKERAYKEKMNSAKMMKKEGEEVEKIAKFLGIPIEEIKKIKIKAIGGT